MDLLAQKVLSKRIGAIVLPHEEDVSARKLPIPKDILRSAGTASMQIVIRCIRQIHLLVHMLDFKDNIFVPSSMHSTKMSMDSAAMQPHHSSQSSLFSVAHMLHGSRFCIVHWILTNNDCPMCRSDYSVVHSEKLVCPIVGTGRGG